MQYVKKSLILSLFAGQLVLLGCMSSAPKKELSMEGNAPRLSETQLYIPVLQKNKEGAYIPYEPAENPYALQKGRIKKASVLAFIDAQRAFKQEKYNESKAILESLTAENKKLSGPWVMLGDIAFESGDYETAEAHFVKALSINEQNMNAYLRLALSQRHQGKYILSQNTYAEALGVWPDCPEAHLNLAILYDIYLNHPIRAQKHMEAYQFLTNEDDGQAAKWLEEIKSRTGIATELRPIIVSEIEEVNS